MSNHSNFGKCIRIAQEKTEVSTKALCEKIGVTPQQVSRWRVAKNIKLHTAQDIAEAFGMSLSDLLELEK